MVKNDSLLHLLNLCRAVLRIVARYGFPLIHGRSLRRIGFVVDDTPIAEPHLTFGILGNIGFMGHEYYRQALLI